jgi:methylenetetrahydrofolate reductase (NADPH)
VHVGIAGPASVSKLIRFAIQCGVGASMYALTRGLSAAVHGSALATTADQHLLALTATPMSPQFVAPHFFAFGGAVETGRWIQKIAAGAFDIDTEAGKFRLHD